MTYTLHHGDCLETLRTMPDNSVDSIVTDPPYGLSFMGKRWDYDVPSVEIWAECLRVLKPGGHLLAFAGTRTQHRMAVRIEDAGFEIRDMIAWVYGSGFPKSMDVSKAIDKAAGRIESGESVASLKKTLIELFDASGKKRKAIDEDCGFRACNYLTLPGDGKRPDPWVNVLPSQEKWETIKRVLGCEADISARLDVLFTEAEREVIGQQTKARSTAGASALPTIGSETIYRTWDITAPATEAARQWQGWGTALKPALEPITVARKPLVGTVAANVLQHGTGALNIDGCRVGSAPEQRTRHNGSRKDASSINMTTDAVSIPAASSRWPANLIHDGSEEVLAGFPRTAPSPTGPVKQGGQKSSGGIMNATGGERDGYGVGYGDTGSAARFFKQVAHDDEDLATMQRFMYCAKASKRDRDEGLDGFEVKAAKSYEGGRIVSADHPETAMGGESNRANIHPTVKPTDLMRYLCRLVTPPGGVVLDPFMGSGSTGKAARLEGFRFVGCELSAEYLEIARARIESAAKPRQPGLSGI